MLIKLIFPLLKVGSDGPVNMTTAVFRLANKTLRLEVKGWATRPVLQTGQNNFSLFLILV